VPEPTDPTAVPPPGVRRDPPRGGSATAHADAPSGGDDRAMGDGWRRLAVGAAVARYAVPLLALPLVPLLVTDRLPLLVLLRPTKDFLLLGGGQRRVLGDPSVLLLLAAYLPLMLFGVWAFYAVGRAYREQLRSGDGPGWLRRTIPPDKLELAQAVLAKRGPAIAILGRLAALPPTVIAAAAGVSDVDTRRFLVADAIGALASFAMVVAAGYALGRAWEEGGIWLTAGGLVLFVALIALLTRWLRAEANAHGSAEPAAGDA
jgi:membrane protein DedA with SNARE-associated domain